jgi:hypothetical protein
MPAHCVLRIKPGRELEVNRILTSLGFDTRTPVCYPDDGGIQDEGVGGDDGRAGEVLVTEFQVEETTVRGPSEKGKYGATLKQLSPSELDHVVEYASIMGSRLRFEYNGSPGIRRGMYTVVPISTSSGPDGAVVGKDVRTGTRKSFARSKITSVGVVDE